MSTLPPGSECIDTWARFHRLPYRSFPEDAWFRAWEPFWVLISPLRYLNAVQAAVGYSQVVLVEPWYAEEGFQPERRSLFAFVSHPGLRYRAAARIGASSLTRVTFLGGHRPVEQSTGDTEWDHLALTYAASPLDAVRAFTPSLRKLLLRWRFTGHLELRHGGLLLHLADAQPVPQDLERVLQWVPMVLDKALKERP
ncbi:MAG: hypothetical protein RMJ98_16190 [Myxococcales bacterium]|nr:hypothetical protein [Polyangiaceae bacterium]MDW8250836.1 hypothetical protein [Myxococcales bacterium]